MIENPPKTSQRDLINAMYNNKEAKLNELVDQLNEKYAYWSEVKYQKLPSGITVQDLWHKIKLSRIINRQIVWQKYHITMTLTNQMQRFCHNFDMSFGGSFGSESIIPIESKEQYLISSLMEEAISSSQMEGASTTRKVAKEMLMKGISPRDKSQQMIFNNYNTIRFIVENKNTPLSTELLLKIHALMTNKTLDNPEDAGRFRTNDEVVVEDGITHEIVHTLPVYKEIPEFIETLCNFFNEEQRKTFIHPIIRGIIIHFMIAYMHPFVDGNGRTARALFYWYLLHKGYWLTEYLSISRIISRSKKSYERAFLYTEADQNDIGYFITYNLRIIDLAFQELQNYIKYKQKERKDRNTFLRIDNINERQADIINLFYNDPQRIVTIKELENRFSVTATTAKSDIQGLLNKQILSEISFNKIKRGYIKGEKFDEIVNYR